MSTETIPMSKTHHGHSIKRVRDMLGIKQETLAAELNMTQQAFSKLEQKEQIEDEMLDKIAKILHVSTEALKTMSEEATINYINTFTDNDIVVSRVFEIFAVDCEKKKSLASGT